MTYSDGLWKMCRATLGSRDLRSHSVARTYTQPTFCTTTKKKVREKIMIIKVRGKNTGKKNGNKYYSQSS
jgi:ABC-type uncharacterized transport system ATPase component